LSANVATDVLGLIVKSWACATDYRKALVLLYRYAADSLSPGAQGPSRGDLTLRVVLRFFGSACFYVFFAAFGGLLGMLGRLGTLRIFVGLSGSLGACGAYVFFAAFGGLLRVLRSLLGHPVLLQLDGALIVPQGP
jgi:hypothetical protein